MIDPARLYQRNLSIIGAPVGEEIVFMDPGQREYFSMSGIGGVIWDLLEEPVSMDEICRFVVERYSVEDEVCRPDIDSFLSELIDIGVIKAL